MWIPIQTSHTSIDGTTAGIRKFESILRECFVNLEQRGESNSKIGIRSTIILRVDAGLADFEELPVSVHRNDELIGVVLNLLLDADACGVAAGGAVVEKNGTAARRNRLQQGGHFAGVQRIDAGVAVAGEEHDGGVVGAWL